MGDKRKESAYLYDPLMIDRDASRSPLSQTLTSSLIHTQVRKSVEGGWSVSQWKED